MKANQIDDIAFQQILCISVDRTKIGKYVVRISIRDSGYSSLRLMVKTNFASVTETAITQLNTLNTLLQLGGNLTFRMR